MAIVAYTTSQLWPGSRPQGVVAFSTEEAAQLGQARGFVLDLRRMAYLPITPIWFPRLEDPGACSVVPPRRCAAGSTRSRWSWRRGALRC
jgi:hypothetical protein